MARKTGKSAPSGGSVIERKSGTTLRRTTVYFEMALYKKLGHHLVESDRDLSDVVSEAVEQYLAKQ